MPRLVRIGTTIALLAVAILGASAQRAYAQQGWATSPSSLSPVNISGGGADVAFDAAGNGFAVWVQADGTIRSIWLARYEPEIGTWRLPGTQLSSAGQDTMAPRVGVDGAGNAIVAWVRQAGGTYYLESRRYATATDTWSAPAAIATVGVGGAGPDLAVTPSGDAIVAWTSIESVTPLVMTVQAARFAAGTGLWTAAGPISAPGETAFFARVAITPGGDAVAAWSQEVTDTTDLSSFTIVPIADAVLICSPNVRFDRVTAKSSLNSAVVSPDTRMVTTLLVSPAAKVTLPDGKTPPKSVAAAGLLPLPATVQSATCSANDG